MLPTLARVVDKTGEWQSRMTTFLSRICWIEKFSKSLVDDPRGSTGF